MGVLNALRNIGPALYGGVRAMEDADDRDMKREGLEADQAIRKERLDQERLDAPLRRRSLEIGVQDAEHAIARRPAKEAQQDEVDALNLRIARLNIDDKEKLTKEAQTVREREKMMDSGVAALAFGGDPKPLADALAKLYPVFEGLTATRNEDGSITVDKPGGKPHTFKGKKFTDGKVMSPDDEFGMMAKGLLGPMKRLEEQTKQAEKLELESAKTDRSVQVEDLRGKRDIATAKSGEARQRARRMASELRDVSREINTALTQKVHGDFQSYSSNKDDKHLSLSMKTRAAEIYKEADAKDDESMTPAKAAEQAVKEGRGSFYPAKRAAVDAAAKLRKAGIDPKKKEAVKKALEAGNADAKVYRDALAQLQKSFDGQTVDYVVEGLPASQK